MALLSLNLPVIGQQSATEDQKVRDALAAIQTGVNGNLDETNVPNLTAAFTSYELAWIGSAHVSAGAGTYILGSAAPANVTAATAGSTAHVLPLDPAKFNANGRVTKYLLRTTLLANNVAPGFTAPTVSLATVSNIGGASGSIPNLGALSNVVSATPAVPGAALFTSADSADVTAPAAGPCVVTAAISGTQTAGSVVTFVAALFVRQV
jgi:hypothetical protein